MNFDNTFSKDIRKTVDNPEEDYTVKRLFANKLFLSWILKERSQKITEFLNEQDKSEMLWYNDNRKQGRT
jgi:hypothetical protein